MGRPREFDLDAATERAVDVFWCKGYEATSVPDLLSAMGIARASLYAAYGSKEGVYLAALHRYREQLAAPLLEDLASGRDVADVVRDVLHRYADDAVADPERRGCLLVNAAASPDAGGAGASRVVRDSFVALEDALAVAFARSALVNVAGARFDPRDLARFVVITIQGLRVYGRSQPDPARLRAALAVALAPLTAVGPPSRTAT